MHPVKFKLLQLKTLP